MDATALKVRAIAAKRGKMRPRHESVHGPAIHGERRFSSPSVKFNVDPPVNGRTFGEARARDYSPEIHLRKKLSPRPSSLFRLLQQAPTSNSRQIDRDNAYSQGRPQGDPRGMGKSLS